MSKANCRVLTTSKGNDAAADTDALVTVNSRMGRRARMRKGLMLEELIQDLRTSLRVSCARPS
jgi:hypothetical protein